MMQIIIAFLVPFLITYFTLPVVIFLSRHFNIYDIPDTRKVHTRPVSSLGGLGIFAGLAISTLWLVTFTQASELQYFIAAATLIFFVGLKDDLLAISPARKFIGQILASMLVVYIGGVRIESMYGLAGIYDLPESLSIALSCFTVIAIINAINLIDGIDGLAASLSLLASMVLGFYFFMAGFVPYSLLSFILCGALAAFLNFNWQPAKIFMGDSGSLVIGMTLSLLLIKFIEASATSNTFSLLSGPALGFSILAIPLADTIRMFASRMAAGRSPFHPDRNHIHHILLRFRWSHKQITWRLVLANTFFIGFAFLNSRLGNTLLMIFQFSVYLISVKIIVFILNNRRRALSLPLKVIPPVLSIVNEGEEKMPAHTTKMESEQAFNNSVPI